MVEKAVGLWGRVLDILVNNAWGGKEPDGSALTVTESAWDYGMNVMVKSLFLATKYATPHMQKGGKGSIVNISSVHGLLMAPRKLVYEAAKSAVISMTRQMACDMGPLGIRVGTGSVLGILSPNECKSGGTRTHPCWKCSRPDALAPRRQTARHCKCHPLPARTKPRLSPGPCSAGRLAGSPIQFQKILPSPRRNFTTTIQRRRCQREVVMQ